MPETEAERVGIIGAGRISQAIAEIAHSGGRRVVLSNSRRFNDSNARQ